MELFVLPTSCFRKHLSILRIMMLATGPGLKSKLLHRKTNDKNLKEGKFCYQGVAFF